jgi:hypothetical protein
MTYFSIASLQSFSFPCLCRLSSPLLSYIYGGHNFFNCYFSFKCSTPRQPSWSTQVCERRLIQYSTFLPIRSTVNRILYTQNQILPPRTSILLPSITCHPCFCSRSSSASRCINCHCWRGTRTTSPVVAPFPADGTCNRRFL